MRQYPTQWIVVVRFICGLVLHMKIQEEACAGMTTMKFALNHPYRFTDYRVVWLSGFLQSSAIFIVEIVNFISILSSYSISGIVADFMALAVISEFDDAFYSALGVDQNKTIIENSDDFEDLFVVKRTTSQDASLRHTDHKLDDETYTGSKELSIHIPFSERSLCNKLLRLVYLVIRAIYVSVWFYFLPFIALIGSYVVPYVLQELAEHEKTGQAEAALTSVITDL